MDQFFSFFHHGSLWGSDYSEEPSVAL